MEKEKVTEHDHFYSAVHWDGNLSFARNLQMITRRCCAPSWLYQEFTHTSSDDPDETETSPPLLSNAG